MATFQMMGFEWDALGWLAHQVISNWIQSGAGFRWLQSTRPG